MKKIIAVLVLLSFKITILTAQTSWELNLNSITEPQIPNIGTSTNHPLNFYTNNLKRMSLSTGGDFTIYNKLNIGQDDDHVILDYTQATLDFPAVFRIRGGSSTLGPPTGGGNENPDPTPDLYCIDGARMPTSLTAFSQMISVARNPFGSTTTGGNILMGHNGVNAFIETQGTGTGTNNHPGDLFINERCNRNVFVFTGNPFANGQTKVFSVNGKLNVADYMQVGYASAPGFVETDSRLYVYAGTGSLSNGIKVKHGSGNSYYGIKIIEYGLTTKAFAVFKTPNSTTDGTEMFSIQGSGKTILGNQPNAFNTAMLNINEAGGTTATDALDIYEESSGKVNFRVKSNGYVYCREVNVMPTYINFPDYVFEKDYGLPSIKEMESYIDINKHLPNIPSAKEVAENGLNLAEMQVKQMEKIEEVFLYIIQLKKENDQLKSRLEKLETNK